MDVSQLPKVPKVSMWHVIQVPKDVDGMPGDDHAQFPFASCSWVWCSVKNKYFENSHVLSMVVHRQYKNVCGTCEWDVLPCTSGGMIHIVIWPWSYNYGSCNECHHVPTPMGHDTNASTHTCKPRYIALFLPPLDNDYQMIMCFEICGRLSTHHIQPHVPCL